MYYFMAEITEKDIIEEINNFELYYEMSDSKSIIIQYTEKQNNLNYFLQTLPKISLIGIYNRLNINGQRCWERYFKWLD